MLCWGGEGGAIAELVIFVLVIWYISTFLVMVLLYFGLSEASEVTVHVFGSLPFYPRDWESENRKWEYVYRKWEYTE